jgi:hypothetical protein
LLNVTSRAPALFGAVYGLESVAATKPAPARVAGIGLRADHEEQRMSDPLFHVPTPADDRRILSLFHRWVDALRAAFSKVCDDEFNEAYAAVTALEH